MQSVLYNFDGKDADLPLKIHSPCESCRGQCTGNNFRQCRKYKAWLHAKLEQMREQPRKQVVQADTSYWEHLHWMLRNSSWAENRKNEHGRNH